MSADLKAISEDKPEYANVGKQLRGPAQKRKKKQPLLPQKSMGGQVGSKEQEMWLEMKATNLPLSSSTSELCGGALKHELHTAISSV